ncbi:unnamed protein product [Mytilus edulis]|uniref:Uncharacterized protein n=1 Tax=Mytilus edulis TaxID=6550 RepID=A0A8S3PPP0_MYTED|nr:unnamed protein product [Mytilus edulis]
MWISLRDKLPSVYLILTSGYRHLHDIISTANFSCLSYENGHNLQNCLCAGLVFTMVVITCNCLNVKLSSKQNPNTAVFEFLTDSGSENTPFYPNKVLLVEVIDPGITIEQDYLVHRQPIGEWLVHSCLNCGLDVYATKPRSSRLLINQKVQVCVNY